MQRKSKSPHLVLSYQVQRVRGKKPWGIGKRETPFPLGEEIQNETDFLLFSNPLPCRDGMLYVVTKAQ
jgi:hypothetical protein